MSGTLAIIIRGLQEELGLKLEPKKTQVDLLIVDKIEKTAADVRSTAGELSVSDRSTWSASHRLRHWRNIFRFEFVQ